MKNRLKKIKNLFGKKKEEKKFHGIQAHKYGMMNNFMYAIQTSWKYSKVFIISILAFGIISALYMLVSVYLPKIALEMVSRNVTVETMMIVLAIVGLLMLIMSLVTQKLNLVGDYGFDKVQYKLMGTYLKKVFTTDFKNMENPDFLDLTNRAKQALYYYRGFHGYCMRMKDAAGEFLMALLAGIAIVFIHPLLVVLLAVLSFIRYKIFDNTMNWNKREYQDAMQSNWRKHFYLANTTRDFNYAKDIRLFGMANWIEGTWKDINVIFFKTCKKRHSKWVMCEVKMSFIRLIQNAILYTVLIYMIFNKGMSISDFVLYIGLVETFSVATSDLFSNLVWMNMNKMQMDDFRTFMDWKEDEPDAEKNEGTITDIDLKSYEFTFENVSFKYPGHEKYVLKNLNLTIKAGMKLAIVGINGAGKTTLTKLLMRLYEPTEGRILLNGIDVKMYDRTTYHKIFAPVFQNIEVFAFPIWENVSMRERVDTNMDVVNTTLERSGLDKKIEKYEKGVETQLLKIFDTEGIDLSGGERQRLAMARALYQDRSVIVLDEPTAALDALAEDRMYQEFNKMVEGKTSIFISHRLSSTRFCDQIVLFEDGTVAELGTHDELMDKDGKYAHMYHVQAQYYREGVRQMLKNVKKQIMDIGGCIKYFGVFAWKELPTYYFYVILGIVVQSIGPFISIIGTKYLINEIAYDYNRDMKKIVFWAGFICIGTLIYRSIEKFANEKQYYCNDQFDRIIHMQLSMRTMKMKFEYTENSKMLDKIKRAERAFEETNLVQGITEGLVSVISSIIVLAGVFYLVVSCSFILLIPITLSFVINSVMTMKNTKIREKYYAVYADQTREQDYYMDNLTGSQYAKDIRVYDAPKMILKNQARMGENIYQVARKYILKQWKYSRVDVATTQICNIAIYIILGVNTLLKKVTIGDFSSLVQSTIQFKDSMQNISQGIFRLRYTASVLKYFLEYMDMIDEDEEKEVEESLELPDITEAPTIEFRNVSFKYPNTDVYILKNISTTIHSGEHLSIVGQNGAGKTTFIKLLCRLYDVTEGEILLNGVNINEYQYKEYIKLLSVVFQDYKLMAFTIRENIALDESEDEGVKDKVKELYNLIELDEWVNSLEKKDETNLYKMFDESGVEPSGGQAQKLSIVRALYKNSPVVILDEPTAALDPVAEYEVYQHFDSLVGGKTAVYISHRLSSCRFCDRIIVFDGGKIIEDGSHEELMNIPNGFYAKMYNTQAKHYN